MLPKAYVAPASLNLHSQLNQKNSTIAVLRHGEAVSILDVRRRYVKVRSAKGEEGWVDSLDLLSPGEMTRIKSEREQALTLPPEGTATAYETINMHLDPGRKSPAFAQIPEGGSVSVLGRRVTPRDAAAPHPWLTAERPTPSHRQRKSRQVKLNSKQPPMPPPPRPPANWTAIWGSNERTERSEPASEQQSKTTPAKPAVMDAWTLVRTQNDQIGWVLSHSLMMAIPDDVAQYAAGKHITSFFDLGTVKDERDGPKRNWLWTTASEGLTLDFDAWRVFLWNRHHHRYETSYRKRDVEGYFPVRVDPPDAATPGRTFSLITKDADGKLRQRTYFFDGTLVHLTRTVDYEKDRLNASDQANMIKAKNAQAARQSEGWLKREWAVFKQSLSTKN